MLNRVGRAKTAMTGLLLATWLVNCARRENILYFKSQHRQPAVSAQKKTTGISGSAKRDCRRRRRSCMKNPGTRSRSMKSSCLVCIQLPVSYMQTVHTGLLIYRNSHIPSCLTTFVGEGLKCLQNPWRSFHGRHCISTKFWTLWREELAETIQFETAEPNKNSTANPYPLLSPPSGRLWDLTLVMGSHPARHAHPPLPNLHMCWKHHT